MTSSASVRARVAASLAVIGGGTLLTSATQPTIVAVVIGLLLVGVSIVGLEFGLTVGAIGALGASVASIQVSRLIGTWDGSVYLPLALLVVAFALAAVGGSTLRSSVRVLGGRRLGGETVPANGSLGLLHQSVAERRLEEEIDRASFTGSAISVVWIRTRMFDEATGEPDRGRVLRVVSRTVESVMEVVHLPVAYSDADIVGILAETNEAAAERLIERIRRSAASATLLVGPARARRRFSDLATIDVGLVSHPMPGKTAAALIEAARSAIRRTDSGMPRLIPVGPGRTEATNAPDPEGEPVSVAVDDKTLVTR